jgi:uncharacterized protein (DUF305 family)
MTHPIILGAALAVALVLPATAAIEEPYRPGEAPIASTWYGLADPAEQRRDAAYIAGMRPHHAGALTMSEAYLAEPGRSSPLLQALARAIIANQHFEIGVLDAVARDLAAPALRLPFGVTLRPMATEGLGAVERFQRTPVPSVASNAIGPVSADDVRFAKAMIIHHEGALTMARDYHADPAARNGFLGLMNVDIIADQSQEIALMQRVIAAYRGDASRIVVTPGMVHGMEGMDHVGHAHPAPQAIAAAPHVHAPAPQPRPKPAPRPRPSAPPAHHHHH